MHVLIAVHDFAFPDNVYVLENTMKADSLVFCVYICVHFMFLLICLY